jgi:hypothetical protein
VRIYSKGEKKPVLILKSETRKSLGGKTILKIETVLFEVYHCTYSFRYMHGGALFTVGE